MNYYYILIEHMLFSFISINWARKPLITYDKALNFISSANSEMELKIDVIFTEKEYKKGIKLNDKQMNFLNLEHSKICDQWNYTIKP